MSSRREQLLARLVVALTGNTPAGSSVTRSREVSITRAQTPAVVVQASGSSLTRMATQSDKNQFDVDIEIFVRGDPWDSLVDPIDVAAHQVVTTDSQIADIATDVRRISEGFESLEADKTAGTLTVTYRFTFTTARGDITLPG
jgi:hypothetical protein